MANYKWLVNKSHSFTFVLVSPRTLISGFIISGSEHMYRKYVEMSLQYIVKFKNDSSDPDSFKHENIKKFGHLSNHLRKTRLGSPQLEKTDKGKN